MPAPLHPPPDDPALDAALLAAVGAAGLPDASAQSIATARHLLDARLATYHDRIHWLCQRLIGEPERAAELTQETMLVACQHVGDFRGESSFYTWLQAIARHLCMRARERRRDLLPEDGELDPEDHGPDSLAVLRLHERDALLEEASRTVLDAVEQEALYMRYTLGMGYDDITAVLELTDASGARGLLQRCKRKLRRELERRLVELGHGSSLVFGSIGTDE